MAARGESPTQAGWSRVEIDPESLAGSRPFLEAERLVAMHDLIAAENRFLPAGGRAATFRLRMSLAEASWFSTSPTPQAAPVVRHILSLKPLSRVVRDYFLICESLRIGPGHDIAGAIRGDRHGAARHPRRRRRASAGIGWPARSTSISPPRGGFSPWSAPSTGATGMRHDPVHNSPLIGYRPPAFDEPLPDKGPHGQGRDYRIPRGRL